MLTAGSTVKLKTTTTKKLVGLSLRNLWLDAEMHVFWLLCLAGSGWTYLFDLLEKADSWAFDLKHAFMYKAISILCFATVICTTHSAYFFLFLWLIDLLLHVTFFSFSTSYKSIQEKNKKGSWRDVTYTCLSYYMAWAKSYFCQSCPLSRKKHKKY